MRIFKGLVLGTLLLLVALVAIAYALPASYRVTRSIDIDAPASKLYPLVAAPRAWQQWSAWNERDPAMEVVYSGPPAGAGAKWAWKSKSEGDGVMTFTSADPERRIGYSLYFPAFDNTAEGAIVFEALTPTTTRVTWTNEGQLGNNPMMRWMGLAMDQLVGKDFATGLANLKTLASR